MCFFTEKSYGITKMHIQKKKLKNYLYEMTITKWKLIMSTNVYNTTTVNNPKYKDAIFYKSISKSINILK